MLRFKNLFLFSMAALALLAAGCASQSKAQPYSWSNDPIDYHKIEMNPADVHPLLEGDRAPNVPLTAADGSEVKLHDILAKKPTVLIFYRGQWCPYCNRHLMDVQSAEIDLQKMGYQVIAISPDLPSAIPEIKKKDNLDYTLYSDTPMNAARAFGLGFQLDQATIEKYITYGINVEQSDNQLPVPAVYIIGDDGIIRFSHYDPNYQVRLSREDLVKAAEDAKATMQ